MGTGTGTGTAAATSLDQGPFLDGTRQVIEVGELSRVRGDAQDEVVRGVSKGCIPAGCTCYPEAPA